MQLYALTKKTWKFPLLLSLPFANCYKFSVLHFKKYMLERNQYWKKKKKRHNEPHVTPTACKVTGKHEIGTNNLNHRSFIPSTSMAIFQIPDSTVQDWSPTTVDQASRIGGRWFGHLGYARLNRLMHTVSFCWRTPFKIHFITPEPKMKRISFNYSKNATKHGIIYKNNGY